MDFERTEIADVVICKPQVFGDHRGYFFESFRRDQFEDFIGYKVDFCQDNESKSTYGVLRGLHFQKSQSAQDKLVILISGSTINYVVNINSNSDFGNIWI